MADQTVRFLRGPIAGLPSTLNYGAPGWAGDEGLLFVGDSANALKLVGGIAAGTAFPTGKAAVTGRPFYRTDEEKLYRYNGASWDQLGAGDLSDLTGTLDDIADGTNYQKVAATEVDASGRVTQVADGTNTVTAAQARTHIDSTSNPHSTSIANIGAGTLVQLNAALTDVDPLVVKNDTTTSTANTWSATKIAAEIQSAIEGKSWKDPARVATTAAGGNVDLATGGLLSIDGITTVAGDRVLVKNQTSAAQNGVYIADESTWVRSSDVNSADELNGAAILVMEGTLNADSQWVQTAEVSAFGTDPVTWTQFGGAGTYNAGTGLLLTGNTFSARLGAGIGELPTGEIGVELTADGGLELTSLLTGGLLKIKPDTTTANVIALALSSNGAGIAVDGSTIVDNGSEALKVADGGIDALQLADHAVTGVKLNSNAAGNGLTYTSDTLAILVNSSASGNTSKAIDVSSSGIALKIDNDSIVENASGQLEVATIDCGTWT